ncbi:MAG: GDSL-type esterase/lipase family protein [Proteobacteria bacterium]|nr:GDSL-type esterase/lipase family protein [Pseudomonadota bacterium]
MRGTSWCALGAVLLLGCSSGCDGERAKLLDSPRAHTPADAPIAATEQVPDGAPATTMHGSLDAPAGSLDQLLGALAAAERGDPNARVLFSMFGDSHTAGDSMTARLRSTFQAKFGDAGRGFVAAGRPPTRHYYQRDVKYGAAGAWTAAVGGHRGDVEPFGLAGLRVSGERKGAQLWVETCGECVTGKTVAAFELYFYSAPNHGTLRWRVDDGAWQNLPTRTAPIEPPHPARQVIPVTLGAHKLTLEHGGGGPIDLFGVALERMQPGVVIDSLGVVGRRLGSLRSWDWSVIGEQLATRDPRLVVLQYGTNEADDPDNDLEAMAKYFDETILRIHAAAPTASILILGPPDMGVREGGKSCDRMRPAADGTVIPECQWRTPSVLGNIIATEHAAAIRNHVAFFDTFAAMGGADKMHGWVTADPRIAYKDHVHLSDLGYHMWADALSSALLDEYARWRTVAAHAARP